MYGNWNSEVRIRAAIILISSSLLCIIGKIFNLDKIFMINSFFGLLIFMPISLLVNIIIKRLKSNWYYDTTILNSMLRNSIHIEVIWGNNFQTNKPNQIQYEVEIVIDRCIVCQLSIFIDEELLNCPICYEIAHKSHLLEWVRIKGTCPNCEIPIKLGDFSYQQKEEKFYFL